MTIEELAWGADGLMPVVIQDARSGAVLTLAYANREAVERSIAEGTTYLFSRSRNLLWKKGETSGNLQRLLAIEYDCDGDALVYRVEPAGPACHTGTESCFTGRVLFGELPERGAFASAVAQLKATIKERRGASPESSYTARLLAGGVDRIAKKVGEEATEVVIAAKNGSADELRRETADLVYHLLVLLEEAGLDLDAVGEELTRRAT
ncbi:MAG: bifunctional phosphoribosyl-AMP cyclohydrolase/phosphoribosyl-ATP diphosphatase HisIE [Candidatus Eremiobacteraeota bacterium]|nr:bifunctional phosphoribosyl-AMP cyclohydrolase/phosphoribosyl-ATP diphosphatase HisIE [Candidatus Eremiobacteraeota bacterium]